MTCLVTVSLAQERDKVPAPWAGWKPERYLPRPPHPDPPVGLTREPEGGFQSQLADLAAAGRWSTFAAQLVARAENRSLQGRVLDRVGRHPVGVAPAAIAQLRRWPDALRAARGEARGEVQELLRAPHDRRAARLAVLNRFPFAPESGSLAALLGDEALEGGRGEEAAAWWRVARGLAATPALAKRAERRLLWLRARATSAAVTARLGVSVRRGPPGLRWARALPGGSSGSPPRRELAHDAESLYALSGGRLVALSRRDGRVRWSTPPTEPPGGRLRVSGRGALVHASGKILRTFRAGSGQLLWTRTLELDEIRELQPWSEGWIVLGGRDGHWRALGLDREGRLLWATRLWEIDPPLARPIRIGEPGKAPAEPAGAVRRVVDDGRLAVLADGVAVCAGGRLAVLGALRGEIRWARERLGGLGLGGGGPIAVDLRLGAFELWATTAAGLFIRLDSATGQSLSLPVPPRGPRGPQAGYLVCSSPPTWVWANGALGGVGEVPSATLAGAAGPCWSGASVAGWLALPRGESLTLLRGRERQSLAWPNGPGAVKSIGDELLIVTTQGLAILGWGPPSGPARPGARDLASQVAALGDPAWRVRQAALRRLLENPGAIDEVREAATRVYLEPLARSEVKFVLGALISEGKRRARWAAIAPGVSWASVSEAARDPSGDRLRALAPKVKASPAAAAGLGAESALLSTWAQRTALLELYLRADPGFEGRLVALCGASGVSEGVQQAAAHILIRSAAAGGPKRGLRLLLKRQSFPVIRAMFAFGSQALWEEVAPADLKGLKLRQVGLPFGKGVLPDVPALWRTLEPVLRR